MKRSVCINPNTDEMYIYIYIYISGAHHNLEQNTNKGADDGDN